MAGNSLQAMLDRAKAGKEPIESEAKEPKPSRSKSTAKTRAKKEPAQPPRKGTRLIGGHFAPEIATQLRILAAEEETTIQSLLAEALNDLFVKKGRKRIG